MSPGIKSIFPLPPAANKHLRSPTAWARPPLLGHACRLRYSSSRWPYISAVYQEGEIPRPDGTPESRGGGEVGRPGYKHRSNLPSSPPLLPSTGNHTEQAGQAHSARVQQVRTKKKSSNFIHSVGDFDSDWIRFFFSFISFNSKHSQNVGLSKKQ